MEGPAATLQHFQGRQCFRALAIELLPELEAPFRKIIWPVDMIVLASFEDL
jgi:hypothetical protein